jgi:hypothetical protein
VEAPFTPAGGLYLVEAPGTPKKDFVLVEDLNTPKNGLYLVEVPSTPAGGLYLVEAPVTPSCFVSAPAPSSGGGNAAWPNCFVSGTGTLVWWGKRSPQVIIQLTASVLFTS